MSQITNITVVRNGQKGNAGVVNANFDEIKTKYNAHDSATQNIHNIGTNNIASEDMLQALIDSLTPIGEVIDIWRPDTGIAFPALDTGIWQLVNGDTIDDEDSLFDKVVLPDFDDKYAIGDTVTDATPVGNENNIIDIAHTHDNTHTTHSTVTHSHRASTAFDTHSHTITSGECYFFFRENYFTPFGWTLEFWSDYAHSDIAYNANLYTDTGTHSSVNITGTNDRTEELARVRGVVNSVASWHSSFYYSCTDTNPAQGNASSNTSDSKLSTTQSVQPKSLKVRKYIRYK